MSRRPGKIVFTNSMKREVYDSIEQPLFATAHSPIMQVVAHMVEQIAGSDLDVLIVGESGTGKEWFARQIHTLGHREHKPFVCVECTAAPARELEELLFGYEAITRDGVDIKQGAFEEADGGTIVFNNLACVPLALQTKIARVLEHQHVRRIGGRKDYHINDRFIASMTRKPDVLVDEELLSKDILYRISPIILNLPPLRERKPDIPYLIEEFLNEANLREDRAIRGISQEALSLCLEYDWSGNTRQLKNAINYAVLMSAEQTIEAKHLPHYVGGGRRTEEMIPNLRELMQSPAHEKMLIVHALHESRSKKEAAELLGISLKTLYNKLNRYRITHEYSHGLSGDRGDRTN